jgi:glutamate-5-semialdehyde dehydrogenase
MSSLIDQCGSLKRASALLARASTDDKNSALCLVAKSIRASRNSILQANLADVEAAREKGMKESLVDRLSLSEKRIDEMILGIEEIVRLPDPVWRSTEAWTLPNGLSVQKMTVPLGVIAIIYESRPNVTVDAFSLAMKSGNCILLRGSSSALHSNMALVSAIREGLSASSLSPDIIELADSGSRDEIMTLLSLREYIDLVIPRGGRDLIDFVVSNSRIPTIETGVGNCHVFVDESADFDKALDIVENAKVQRPGVCNAIESLLVHADIAADFLPLLYARIGKRVEFRGCERTCACIPAKPASEEDWATEYLDYILAVKVVDSFSEAVAHIERYGTRHSETIVTENYEHAMAFVRQVDAAAVYVNASTRFTDGGQMGFGAEMGISTQKIHARGPIGLPQLVSVKFVGFGNGQVRT